ncbi:MAG: hypothetical protein ACHQWU_10195 [Gemmatimonadales bacterium]|jgi:hypothetical protein
MMPAHLAELVRAMPRRWIAVGVALLLPWVWLSLLDPMLRRKR